MLSVSNPPNVVDESIFILSANEKVSGKDKDVEYLNVMIQVQ